MKQETIMVNVWVVSYFNAFDGSHYNNLHTNCDSAMANFDEVVDESFKFASVEMSDFRVSRSLCRLTIYDVADDNRAVLACKVSKQTIPCGIMCM
jgi:hypothetical protein